jgi:hypothetical protein
MGIAVPPDVCPGTAASVTLFLCSNNRLEKVATAVLFGVATRITLDKAKEQVSDSSDTVLEAGTS